MRRRIAWIGAACLAGLALVFVAAVLVLRSAWFNEKVRERVVSTVETATGAASRPDRFSSIGGGFGPRSGPLPSTARRPPASRRCSAPEPSPWG